MKFMQINMKQAFVACVELNRYLTGLDQFICFATEPYQKKGKLAGIPSNRGRISGSGKDTRTGILFGGSMEGISVEPLSNPTVQWVSSVRETILLC